MPIFFQQEIDATTRLAIWKIEEDELFFLAQVPLQRSITHPHKRLQHLAGRYLLRYLFPDFPVDLIQIADTRKPFLEDEAYHFSISHCGDYAGVIVSKNRRVGIDIELLTEKVQRIRHKFISETEEEIINNQFSIINSQVAPQISAATLIWSCKEAIFKWYGLGNMDFRTDMQMRQMRAIAPAQFETDFILKKRGDVSLLLRSRFFESLCLSFVTI